MNRLTYPTQPETWTVTTPLGKTHHINVWLPVGERSKPVMAEELPKQPKPLKPPPPPKPKPIKAKYLYQRVAIFILQSGKGCTVRGIGEALNIDSRRIGRIFYERRSIFYPESKRSVECKIDEQGQRSYLLYKRWRVRESFKMKGKN